MFVLQKRNLLCFREAAKVVGDAEHSVISGLWTAGACQFVTILKPPEDRVIV